ncbi:MAG TPA: tRNA pseudouridine(55) synthase TruB [Candidatus Limnocylindria bacterium]|nr:tRNA pseudouridine(55) synthase TruB [Candidatus Limnocylindria bacterium]
MTGRRPEAPAVDGVLVVAKAPGPTSHDMVGLVRRLTGVRRVGHGGTLDPFAAGVLPVFIGHATRLAEYHLADDKEYAAEVCFGARSTTDDIDGQLTPTGAAAPTRDQAEAALDSFRGEIEQVPPDYSAVHVGGRRAYELARHGKKPELRPRRVTIKRLELVEWNDVDPARPIARLEVACSAGTYIRALCRDLGELLGCGAYLGALTRTVSGPFSLAEAHSIDDVRAAHANGELGALMLPPDAGLDGFPRLTLGEGELMILARGQPVSLPAGAGEGLHRIVDENGRLAAMGRAAGGRLRPEKVFISPTG